MVRLKVAVAIPLIATFAPFQFQYGAIESNWHDSVLDYIDISIPVWCDWKDVAVLLITPVEKFQFQYGAIESSLSTVHRCTYDHFNSSMVRLKDYRNTIIVIVLGYFNSSMVRLKAYIIEDPIFFYTFQFQYGAIERGSCFRWRCYMRLFQFQYGAIERKIDKNDERIAEIISIPVWCDWKKNLQVLGCNPSTYFNSSMVRLKAKTSE